MLRRPKKSGSLMKFRLAKLNEEGFLQHLLLDKYDYKVRLNAMVDEYRLPCESNIEQRELFQQ